MNLDMIMACGMLASIVLWLAESVKLSYVTLKYEQERRWRHEDSTKIERCRRQNELMRRMVMEVVTTWTPPVQVPEKAEADNPYTDMPY